MNVLNVCQENRIQLTLINLKSTGQSNPKCLFRAAAELFIIWARPEVIKNFPCSTQLCTKFQLLIKTKLPTIEEVYCFKSLRCCIYHANKC